MEKRADITIKITYKYEVELHAELSNHIRHSPPNVGSLSKIMANLLGKFTSNLQKSHGCSVKAKASFDKLINS